MDWPLAISRNREALLRIVAALLGLAGLAQGQVAATLPRHIYHAILRVLRPAESAMRRLIIIAARGLVVAARPPRAAPVGLIARTGCGRTPAFQLIDPLKTFGPAREEAGPLPRISVPGFLNPIFASPAPALNADDPINAVQLCQRLDALRRALDSLPRQARRLVRWQAQRNLALQSQTSTRRSMRMSPFRPGLPPGARQRHTDEIHGILRECHALARDAIDGP